MIGKRIICSALVAGCVFSGMAMAQQLHQYEDTGAIRAPSLSPSPLQTQKKRCENLGALVSQAAIARDQHESKFNFIRRLGGQHRLSPGVTDLIAKVFDGDATPVVWQNRMQNQCERNIS